MPSAKRVLVFSVRVLLCVAAWWVLRHTISLDALRNTWRNSDKALLLLAVAVFMAVPLLQALRLQWMLRALNVHLGLWDNVKLAFAGNFLNFAAPLGSTAGDVFKAYYVARQTTLKTEAATTVFIDRAVGLATLLLAVGVVAAISSADGRLAPVRGYVLALLAAGVAGTMLYLSPWAASLRLPDRLAARFSLFAPLCRIDHTARTLARRPGIVAGAVLITFILQVIAAAAFIIAGRGLGLTFTWSNTVDVFACFSAGEVIKAVPGPPQGFGTCELAYSYFFAGLGSASQIVAAALAIRGVNLVCAVPGLLVTLTGACRPRAAKDTCLDRRSAPAPAVLFVTNAEAA